MITGPTPTLLSIDSANKKESEKTVAGRLTQKRHMCRVGSYELGLS